METDTPGFEKQDKPPTALLEISALALKVARALGISAAILVARTEQALPASYKAGGRPG